MKIIKNTLEAELDRFEDPGDYPNALAAGPLPPGPWQVVGVDGEIVLGLDDTEFRDCLLHGLDEFLETTDGIELPDGVSSIEWQINCAVFLEEELQITLSCADFTIDNDYSGPEPPDYEDY